MKGIVILFVIVCAAVVRGQRTQCPTEQETDWEIEWLLRHEDCNKFYQCTFGQPVEHQCPADLYFNLETWKCDWQHNVDCTDRNVPGVTTVEPPSTTSTTPAPTTTTPVPTTTTTTPIPTTTTTTTPVPTTTTTTTPVPTTTTTTTPVPTTTTTTTPVPTTTTTTTPVPTTTTTTTPVPTTTTTTTPVPTTTTTTTPVPTTTTTTTPVPTTTTTTTPVPTTTTTTTPVPTTTTTTTTTPPPTTEADIEFLGNGCPVDPHIHWLLPHEEDCNLFYYCVWGQKVLRQCPSVLHFNTVLQVCDWTWDAGCTL